MGGTEEGGPQVHGQPGLANEMVFHKTKNWECRSLVEHLPGMHMALIQHTAWHRRKGFGGEE